MQRPARATAILAAPTESAVKAVRTVQTPSQLGDIGLPQEGVAFAGGEVFTRAGRGVQRPVSVKIVAA